MIQIARPPSRLLRLALLKCDTPHERLLVTHGDYLDIFRDYLTRSIDVYNRNLEPAEAGSPGLGISESIDDEEGGEKIEFELDGYDVVYKMEYPDLKKYDGVVLTGSGESDR
jgi:hypothetical protein